MPDWAGSVPMFSGAILATVTALYVLYSLKVILLHLVAKLLGRHDSNAKKLFVTHGHDLVRQGLADSDICHIMSDNGVQVILSPVFADELRSNPSLTFSGSVSEEFHSHIKGFEPTAQFTHGNDIFQDAVRVKLNQALGSITKPLSDETSMVLKEQWTDNPEWHDFVAWPIVGRIVAQLSSRVFLGGKICCNPDWLRVTTGYSLDCVFAAERLRLWPKIVRPWVAPFLPLCRKLRRELQEAREIIAPVLEERRRAEETAQREGKPAHRYNDAMEWMEQIAKGRPYNPAVVQMTFSGTSIVTSTDLLTQVLFDLCDKDDLVQALREEIISVTQEEGWKKSSLSKLQLMDSFLKESQRLKPISVVSMKRRAEDTIYLSDGTRIPKGTQLMVSCDWMADPRFYENPNEFDPYRFLKLRQIPGNEKSAPFVSTSPQYLAFGLGRHACPGRFFVANEMKVALCHILLKYDLALPKGTAPQHRKWGLSLTADPEAKIMIRRRQEEIKLEDVTD